MEFIKRYVEDSGNRLAALREKRESWREEDTNFFDVRRSRAWIMTRRMTHMSHHRGQLMAMLRMLGHDLHSNYGPTADTGGLLQDHQADVLKALVTSLQFSAEVLESIDSTRRLRSVAPLVAILDAGYASWTTEAEMSTRRGSHTMRVGNSDETATAVLNPPTRGRPALQLQTQGIAEDLTVLLKRQLRS